MLAASRISHASQNVHAGGQGSRIANCRKTELCVFFRRGRCAKGLDCNFAHGDGELRPVPDFTKTSLCKKWRRRECRLDARDCPFAHGANELRRTQETAQRARRRATQGRGDGREEAPGPEAVAPSPAAPGPGSPWPLPWPPPWPLTPAVMPYLALRQGEGQAAAEVVTLEERLRNAMPDQYED